jgi:uncharacterized protein (TIGR02246 family)
MAWLRLLHKVFHVIDTARQLRCEVIDSYFAAVNAHRLDGAASFFTTDGRFIFPGRPGVTGRIAIADQLAWALRHYDSHSDTVTRVRFTSTDVADVHINFEGTLRANNRQITFNVIDTIRFADKLPVIAELRMSYDQQAVDGLLRNALKEQL